MTQSQRLQLQPDWRVTVLALALLPVVISLGFWQLDRADEKRQLIALFDQRKSAPAVPISQLSLDSDLRYRQVQVRGRYLDNRQLLLDNRIRNGQFGYDAVTPLRLEGTDEVVLINRGWIKGDPARRALPRFETPAGNVELRGEIYVPQGEMMRLADDSPSGWPRVVQSIDVSALQDEFSDSVFPYSVRLSPSSPGALTPDWDVVNLQPRKHTGYAVQWFAMGVALVVVLVLGNTNLWSVIRRRQQ